ncbi:MAG: nucleotidyltransferase substrate binding protein [Deltaproteobacteria bacterium]|nr:nucleotidyltransferase substrate binding protein [Deltaproteobacteria bacterium]MBF0524588.1 nucleotidyltransferase substrate binding protein [Deltaproteobacteria bacterium]
MIDYEKLQKSLKNLELQVENYNRAADRRELTDLDREALAESVIHRFETCYDMLWKHLKRYIVEELGLPDVPNSPKPVFRLAAENKLLANAVEQWLNYADARTATAHDYSGKKAADCLQVIPDFIDDAIGLYQTMTGTSWE